MQALGLSDVLRAELQPCQLASVVEQLDELRRPLVESFQDALRHWNDLSSRNGNDATRVDAAEAEVDRAAYAVRVVDAIRSALPTEPPSEPFEIVGPAAMVSAVMAGAARSAATRVAELISATTRPDAAVDKRLRELATAAYAWVETDIDRRSLEWYSFDAAFDLPPEL